MLLRKLSGSIGFRWLPRAAFSSKAKEPVELRAVVATPADYDEMLHWGLNSFCFIEPVGRVRVLREALKLKKEGFAFELALPCNKASKLYAWFLRVQISGDGRAGARHASLLRVVLTTDSRIRSQRQVPR